MTPNELPQVVAKELVSAVETVIVNLNNATAVMRDKRTETGPNRAWLTEQVNILRAALSTPPAPSSSAVEGLVADWSRQADYARGCSAQRKRDGKDHDWFDACADTFTVAANKLKEALASTAASGGEPVKCQTCNGYGLIDMSSGQTPDNFQQDAMPCDDCNGTGKAATTSTAAPAMPEGFVMMPRKPTPEILAHAWGHRLETKRKHYAAMLAASAQGDGDG